MPELLKRAWPRRCATKRCRKPVFKLHRSPYCSRCRTRRFKARFPLKWAFNMLRGNAKRRGKLFALTYAQYEQLAIATGYAEQKGKLATCLSIDRIDNNGGYSLDNIRVVAVSVNAARQNRQAYVPYFQGLSDSDKAPDPEPDDADQPWLELQSTLGTNEPF
jgi:hypothetical protein